MNLVIPSESITFHNGRQYLIHRFKNRLPKTGIISLSPKPLMSSSGPTEMESLS